MTIYKVSYYDRLNDNNKTVYVVAKSLEAVERYITSRGGITLTKESPNVVLNVEVISTNAAILK